MRIIHTPVLLEETIALLAPSGGACLIADATQGEGGHSEAFLSRFPDLSLIGIDADALIQARAKARLERFGERARFYAGWAQDFFTETSERFDRILIDLGVSLFHYAESGRGFSFAKDEPLDMRIDPSRARSAAQIIADSSETELADMLFLNAEERYSRRIARRIVEERGRAPLVSAKQLADIVASAVPARRGAIHPATKTFQALRIEANGELEKLPALLELAVSRLKQNGRLGVISFHSIEDRMVKRFFKTLLQNGSGSLITKKAVSASFDEVKKNPPSRSARLRVVMC
jgi:16S rRNA (cytosine1402-N4)-methyltransferase